MNSNILEQQRTISSKYAHTIIQQNVLHNNGKIETTHFNTHTCNFSTSPSPFHFTLAIRKMIINPSTASNKLNPSPPKNNLTNDLDRNPPILDYQSSTYIPKHDFFPKYQTHKSMIHSRNSNANHTFRCWKEHRTGVCRKKSLEAKHTNTKKSTQYPS